MLVSWHPHACPRHGVRKVKKKRGREEREERVGQAVLCVPERGGVGWVGGGGGGG